MKTLNTKTMKACEATTKMNSEDEELREANILLSDDNVRLRVAKRSLEDELNKIQATNEALKDDRVQYTKGAYEAIDNITKDLTNLGIVCQMPSFTGGDPIRK
ncbi:hypothetical protein GUJ93_ZPchr0002g24249 [Zizania palustris]|uniref:Uncharacterized protein n=1 Tax=Zizania palustris TaxID=103762 RepID=A0A8J5SB04_ZIZPA|nr:hypothetical protein GUJ93_ZPchr0002g24249 [Zizania palustris]